MSEMNIDKFGHHVHKRLRLSEVTDFMDNTLRKTENGNFDLKLTRLTGVKLPSTANDAANKEYVDNVVKLCCSKDDVLAHIKSIKADINKVLSHFIKEYYTKTEVDKIVKAK